MKSILDTLNKVVIPALTPKSINDSPPTTTTTITSTNTTTLTGTGVEPVVSATAPLTGHNTVDVDRRAL